MTGFPANTGFAGDKTATDGLDKFNALAFAVNQALSGIATATVVKVIGINSSVAPRLVNVQPMVNQIDGNGNPTPQGSLFNLPFIRLQGGTGGIIADPVIGDIGLAVFASRDISLVKRSRALANPGSRRKFDMADGIYHWWLGEHTTDQRRAVPPRWWHCRGGPVRQQHQHDIERNHAHGHQRQLYHDGRGRHHTRHAHRHGTNPMKFATLIACALVSAVTALAVVVAYDSFAPGPRSERAHVARYRPARDGDAQ
jgi:hypothetical protein